MQSAYKYHISGAGARIVKLYIFLFHPSLSLWIKNLRVPLWRNIGFGYWKCKQLIILIAVFSASMNQFIFKQFLVGFMPQLPREFYSILSFQV